ncbi:hypothetical protein GLOTRDRAFT_127167 [Gloeophyllum trabeum ATCC 11539]|uniref:Uncharacterized protein n=1 Tax=Gloeophyllum trabeum (strain ATCC 11539 / FP-39264 / Madison 617) TaxID=670483 RepID=S7QHM5_GLOTA|nr:uncharacterized protein GLOTRDRAFT_127167 [Gloeophyllum trabeum ATCC 11539]EPQ58677.1 hypothetical protein GLOTRDRAFT_127167 [Gloeophyllum trabeum ATCC 11539]
MPFFVISGAWTLTEPCAVGLEESQRTLLAAQPPKDRRDQPRFVKIKCKVEPNDEEPGYGKGYMFDSTPFIGERGWPLCVDRMGINGPALKNPFLIWHREMFLEDGSPINRCIQRMTNNQAAHPWAGNILVMKHDQSNLTYNSIYVDATADDIPVVATYFSKYPSVSPRFH